MDRTHIHAHTQAHTHILAHIAKTEASLVVGIVNQNKNSELIEDGYKTNVERC